MWSKLTDYFASATLAKSSTPPLGQGWNYKPPMKKQPNTRPKHEYNQRPTYVQQMVTELRSSALLFVFACLMLVRCDGLSADYHGGVSSSPHSAISPASSVRRALIGGGLAAVLPATAFAAPLATSTDGSAVTLRLADGSTQTFPAQPLPADNGKGLKLPITDITKSVFGLAEYPEDYPLTAKDMKRLDESDDSSFYDAPRLVYHIDGGAVAALTNYYSKTIDPKASHGLLPPL